GGGGGRGVVRGGAGEGHEGDDVRRGAAESRLPAARGSLPRGAAQDRRAGEPHLHAGPDQRGLHRAPERAGRPRRGGLRLAGAPRGGRDHGDAVTARRFVIVGAALAGASAAAALREEGFDGEVVLVGAESRLPYNRPPLSKGYLRGQERFEDGLVNPAELYAQKRIYLVLGARATRVDPGRKVVALDGGRELAYDR